jgi:hypothetical protein
MKLTGVKWVDSLEKLPYQGGVYYISSDKTKNEIVYVGQSENLKKRLKARHPAWNKAKVEFISPWIGYELIPDEKERKTHEHLRIGQLNPRYNDGGLRESEWQLLSAEYVDSINVRDNQEKEISLVTKWLNLTWNNLDKAQGLTLLERDSKSWIDSYPKSWKSQQKLIELYTEINELNSYKNSSRFIRLGSCRGIDLLYMEHLELCTYSQMVPEEFLKIQNKRTKFWINDESKQLETSVKALMKIQDYLNPDFFLAWPIFLKHVNFLVSEGVYEHDRDTVIDFLDHCIAWSLVLDVPYLRLLPRERKIWFNGVFLEYVYRNKHQVEDWAQHYIGSEDFVVGFHQWCIEENLIPEILYQDEEKRPANARVRIRV